MGEAHRVRPPNDNSYTYIISIEYSQHRISVIPPSGMRPSGGRILGASNLGVLPFHRRWGYPLDLEVVFS